MLQSLGAIKVLFDAFVFEDPVKLPSRQYVHVNLVLIISRPRIIKIQFEKKNSSSNLDLVELASFFVWMSERKEVSSPLTNFLKQVRSNKDASNKILF